MQLVSDARSVNDPFDPCHALAGEAGSSGVALRFQPWPNRPPDALRPALTSAYQRAAATPEVPSGGSPTVVKSYDRYRVRAPTGRFRHVSTDPNRIKAIASSASELDRAPV